MPRSLFYALSFQTPLQAESTLVDIQDDDRFTANLFVSDPSATHSEVDVQRDPQFARIKHCIRSMNARPNLREELQDLGHPTARTLLFVCGPKRLSDACAKLAKGLPIHFRTETFSK